jgi:aminoacyl tRNA synthase complex-interacting multifunctional protein 1
MMSQSALISQLIGFQLPATPPDFLDENTHLVESLRNANNLCGTKFFCPLGRSLEEEIEISSWMSWARKGNFQAEDAEQILRSKSYLVGHRPSVADVAVFVAFHQSGLFVKEAQSRVNLCRWATHIEKLVTAGILSPLSFSSGCEIAMLPLPLATQVSEPPTTTAVADEQPTGTASSQQPETKASKQSAPKQHSGDGKEKESKKADKKETAASTEVESVGSHPEPGRLDIRVGQVIRCWNHAESDKLLCEEIDLGEAAPRQIASGIRAFYSAEQVTDRKVLVLANLKERSIAGFKSAGMVLCASTADKSDVKLLEPPKDAVVGSRVTFIGSAGVEIATPAQMTKKKILETLAPLLRTDATGIAHCGPFPFSIDGQPCKAPIQDAIVS